MRSAAVTLLMLTILALILQAGQAQLDSSMTPRGDSPGNTSPVRTDTSKGERKFHRTFELENGTPSSPRGDRATRDAVKARQKWHRIKNFDLKDAVTTFPYKATLVNAAKSTGQCIGKCMDATVNQPNMRSKKLGYHRIQMHVYP